VVRLAPLLSQGPNFRPSAFRPTIFDYKSTRHDAVDDVEYSRTWLPLCWRCYALAIKFSMAFASRRPAW